MPYIYIYIRVYYAYIYVLALYKVSLQNQRMLPHLQMHIYTCLYT